jgi:hypothetical protein
VPFLRRFVACPVVATTIVGLSCEIAFPIVGSDPTDASAAEVRAMAEADVYDTTPPAPEDSPQDWLGKDAPLDTPEELLPTPAILADGLNRPTFVVSDASRVYWTEFGDPPAVLGSVKSCPIAGCGRGPLVYGSGYVSGIAVDATNVYWSTSIGGGAAGGIWSCPIGGCPANPTRVAAANIPGVLALDSSYVYWIESPNSKVSRAPKDGTGGALPLYGGMTAPLAFQPSGWCAVDGAYFYFPVQSASIYAVSLLGGVPITFDVEASDPSDWPIALGSTTVYYGTEGGVFGVHKGGTSVAAVSPPVVRTTGLFVDSVSGFIYWSDWGTGAPVSDGRIGRVMPDGTMVADVASKVPTPHGVTISGDYALWLSTGTPNPDAGSSYLTSTVPNTGMLVRSAK